MTDALIRYRNVEIHQQELCVLNDVDLELHGGEFVYLIGKVGSGKTSLLKTFYGELDTVAGEAEVLGYDMRRIKRKHIPRLRRRLGSSRGELTRACDSLTFRGLARTAGP